MTFLPLDYSRCIGKPAGPQGLNFAEECRDCLRRTAPRPRGMVSQIEPPKETPCPDRIPPEQMGS